MHFVPAVGLDFNGNALYTAKHNFRKTNPDFVDIEWEMEHLYQILEGKKDIEEESHRPIAEKITELMSKGLVAIGLPCQVCLDQLSSRCAFALTKMGRRIYPRQTRTTRKMIIVAQEMTCTSIS